MSRPLRDITVAIPAAGRVPRGTLTLGRASSPAMIPVAGRPVAYWTIRYLATLGLERFLVALPEREPLFEEFMVQAFRDRAVIEFLVPIEDRGVGGTIAELANCITTEAALFVLGDTIFEFDDPGVLNSQHPVVLTSQVEDPGRWCVADTDTNQTVTALFDKVSGLEGPREALIGVYFFPDVGALRRASKSVLELCNGSLELAPILMSLAKVSPLLTTSAATWLDCGNPDRQGASQRALLQQRVFNDITVDDTFGTITKRSANAEKFIDEINFLRLLPDDLLVLFPRVLDASTRWESPSVTMEFYGYPTLSELFLFEHVDAGMWRGVFEHLRAIIENGFMRYRRPLKSGALQDMYVEKALRRLDTISIDHPVSRIAQMDHLFINGAKVKGLPTLLPGLSDWVEALDRETLGAVVHGDLCFSNILYDLRSRVVKLIDPRGSFGVPGVFGDPRYDVAKLHHSAVGGYDLITADLFALKVVGDRVEFEVHVHDLHRRIAGIFSDVFASLFDAKEIQLVSGLIFLGLPALHPESTQRQLAFFLRGLQLVNAAFDA